MVHRLIEINRDDVVIEVIVGDLGQEVSGLCLELFEEHTFRGDLRECLAISRAGDRDRHGA